MFLQSDMSESKSGLVLGGHNITIDALVAASQNLTLPVDIAPASLKVVEDSFALLIKAAEQVSLARANSSVSWPVV